MAPYRSHEYDFKEIYKGYDAIYKNYNDDEELDNNVNETCLNNNEYTKFDLDRDLFIMQLQTQGLPNMAQKQKQGYERRYKINMDTVLTIELDVEQMKKASSIYYG